MIRFLFPTDVAMMWFAWVNIVQDDYFLCPGISDTERLQDNLHSQGQSEYQLLTEGPLEVGFSGEKVHLKDSYFVGIIYLQN